MSGVSHSPRLETQSWNGKEPSDTGYSANQEEGDDQDLATNQQSLTRGLRTLEGKVWCSLSHLIATAVSYHADGPLVTFCEKGFA